MKYTKLGNSDLTVSRICMGCMGFGDAQQGQHGWTLDEEHSREIIRRGLELGVNFYDTAIAYQSGTSEQYVGRALRDFAKREDMVVATKFLPRTQDEIDAGITGQQHIERMLNKSLQNLGMDYVDLYIYHMWDWQTPIEDILDGLNRMVKAGKTRYIGISNCFAWQLAKANALAEKEGWVKFISVQGHYNLIFREEEREMVPYCEEEGIALTPYSALASGRLSRKPGETSERLEKDAYARFKYDATQAQDQLIIDRVAELAEKHGVTMTEISLSDDIDIAVSELKAGIDTSLFMKNTCGIIFCGFEPDMGTLVEALDKAFDFPFFGCTGIGVLSTNGYSQSSISLLVLTADDVEL